MNFSKVNKRATRIKVTQLTNPDDVQGYYDEDGKLVTASSTVKKLWGEVMDKRSISRVFESQQRTLGDIYIEVDYRSAKGIKNGQKLTTDRDSNEYAIVDKYDDQWKFSSVIVARYIQ